MKSGMVREPNASVNSRSRGATATHAKWEKPTTPGISNNQPTPHS
jgi:hypothetical protein